MKRMSTLLLASGLVFCTGSAKKTSTVISKNGVALIELFTSEGCSSCPPADKLMEDIDAQKDSNVLVLVYHVDYWNRLGWKDVFSTKANTDRQYYYAQIFGLSSVYTPQAVINGANEFVGSDRNKITNAISALSLEKKPFHINAQQEEDGKIFASVAGIQLATDEEIVLALVQKHALSKIKKGENQGKELSHVNIVRQFSILSNAGSTILTTAGKNKDNFFVAAFIQNKTSGKISGFQTTGIL